LSAEGNTLFDPLGDFPDIDGLFVRFVDVLRECVLTSSGFIFTLRLMTDNRFSGLALIVGSVGSIITMVFHPTGHDVVAPGRFESMAQLTVAVHALALVSMPVLFSGRWGWAVAPYRNCTAPRDSRPDHLCGCGHCHHERRGILRSRRSSYRAADTCRGARQ
jgi:hypothetical protein